MPSGAKKRKAAKKKKENQNQSDDHSDSASTPAGPHGDDRSDVGDVSSPVSQNHQKLPMEVEGEEIEKVAEVTDPLLEVEESVAGVEKEIEVEDESGKRDGGSPESSGGSSSSSDDERPRISGSS